MTDWSRVSLLGVDVGYSAKRATTGIAIYEENNVAVLCRVKSGYLARREALNGRTRFDAIAIDGPILPNVIPQQPAAREAERRLASGPFQKRCKPAASHNGFGLTLRNETLKFVDQFAPMARAPDKEFSKARIRKRSAIVEAFPNSFLGCLLEDKCFESGERLKRGKKFDWLYDNAVNEGAFEKLLLFLKWNDSCLLNHLTIEQDHEKRAALICLLTAACAHAGKAHPIGDEAGGWIFLPPKDLWADWALAATSHLPP